MDDYISKPIKKEELLRVIENVSKNKYSKTFEKEENLQDYKNPEISEQNEILKIQENDIKEENQRNTKQEIKETENKTEKIKPASSNKENIIIASDTDLLAQYLKSIIPEGKIAKNIKELSSLIQKDAKNIIIIEDEFNNSDLAQLIKTLKNNNTKIIALTDKNVEADIIVKDLLPEHILRSIQKVK
jgi:DNA-binding response OmpR family regulator